MTDQEVDSVGGPTRTKRALLRIQRKQALQGDEDEVVAEACRKESLCLITADLDFAQILDYPPENYEGLIVLRHPHPTLAGMAMLVRQIVVALARGDSPVGCLGIVEPGRIRIYEPPVRQGS